VSRENGAFVLTWDITEPTQTSLVHRAPLSPVSFDIYRNDMLIASTSETRFEDTEALPEGDYCYKVRIAFDDFRSHYSEEICAAATSVETWRTASLQIYPNPAKNELFIQSDSPVNKVEIYNLSGVCVLKESNFVGSINISNFAAGVYFAKIYTAAGETVQKIVKE
ncbi:MAG: T9SS type A sorting domain-containing protein, partial [Prevotellaceae bacterium]|nr:T9SS type A sorting domain-containing protein [Prevotellaceae bacterium]